MAELRLIRSPDTERPSRLPPGQHLTDKFPVLHYGRVPRVDTPRWTFSITGLVSKEHQIGYDEFLALPRVRLQCDIHCVTTWSRLDTEWEGVSTAVVRDLARPRSGARFIVVHAANGFTTNLTAQDFFQDDVILALKYGGAPLTAEHGFPVRLVVPRLYFWKSAKWVEGVEFTAEDRPGFWESNGYHNRGDPWLEERYSAY